MQLGKHRVIEIEYNWSVPFNVTDKKLEVKGNVYNMIITVPINWQLRKHARRSWMWWK